jgi:RNA polymerase sigma-70 factor (ECF subfamily)
VSTPAPFPLETLLAERAWVRALARSLVADEHAADDLEQDAWVAVLERPPARTTSPRGWLATVLRRGAGRGRRGDFRRARRERAAARPESLPSTGDVVANAEWHARVVRAVLALEEPYRTTLLLRHFEGLPPREVAARTGVPVETARSRAQRGLARLRERFDAESGGDRRAWAVPVAALAGPGAGGGGGGATGTGTGIGTAAAAATGGLAMTTAAKAGVAGAVLAAAVGAFLLLRDRPEGAAVPRAGDVPAAVARGEPAPGLARSGDATPAAEPVARGEPAPAPPAAAGAAANRLRVVEAPEATGAAVPGATVIGFGAGGERHEATTDATGTIVWPAGTGPFVSGWAGAPGFALRRFERLDPAAGARIALERSPPLAVRFTLDGRDLAPDEARRRYAAAEASPWVRWVPEEALSSADLAHLFRLWAAPRGTWSAGGLVMHGPGGASLSPAPASGVWWVVVERPGDEAHVARLDLGARREVTVPLRGAVDVVRLRAVDAETGAALPEAVAVPYSEIGDDRAFVNGAPRVADGHGEWEVPVPVRASGADGFRNATWWVSSGDDRVASVAAYELEAARGRALDVLLVRTATVRGRAWLPSGLPAAGRTVLHTRKGRSTSTTVAADGSFVLTGVPARPPRANLMLVGDLDRMEVRMAEVDVVPGGEAEVAFGSPRGERAAGTVRGRVTAGGAPVAGVVVAVGGDRAPALSTTDADGRFLAEGVPAGETALAVLLGVAGVADDFAIQSVRPVRVDAGRDTVFDFDLPGGALRVRVVDDATGRPVEKAYVLASPRDRAAERDRFPGFRYGPGWCAATDASGVALLPGLLPGAPHEVLAVRMGDRAEGKADSAVAGTAAAPGEVTVRVRKRD